MLITPLNKQKHVILFISFLLFWGAIVYTVLRERDLLYAEIITVFWIMFISISSYRKIPIGYVADIETDHFGIVAFYFIIFSLFSFYLSKQSIITQEFFWVEFFIAAIVVVSYLVWKFFKESTTYSGTMSSSIFLVPYIPVPILNRHYGTTLYVRNQRNPIGSLEHTKYEQSFHHKDSRDVEMRVVVHAKARQMFFIRIVRWFSEALSDPRHQNHFIALGYLFTIPLYLFIGYATFISSFPQDDPLGQGNATVTKNFIEDGYTFTLPDDPRLFREWDKNTPRMITVNGVNFLPHMIQKWYKEYAPVSVYQSCVIVLAQGPLQEKMAIDIRTTTPPRLVLNMRKEVLALTPRYDETKTLTWETLRSEWNTLGDWQPHSADKVFRAYALPIHKMYKKFPVGLICF
jgi:hypothetical protein